jgi:hypothetical protein
LAPQVFNCTCGHPRGEHKPEIGIKQTLLKMLEKALYDANYGWLYATKSEEQVCRLF